MQYNYCSVVPDGFENDFYYIYDGDDIKYGDRVLVPFGRENRVVSGIVNDSDFYDEGNLPFPLERTKKIISVIRPGRELSEFEEDVIFGKDFKKLDGYIESENYDKIFKWAYDHETFTDSRTVKKKVAKCYSLCVEQNMPDAIFFLGNIYFDGRGVRRNFKKAFELYTAAVSFSIQGAFSALGCCYYYGKGVKKNFKKAFETFSFGVLLHDDSKCLCMIGDMFRDGDFLEKNSAKAFKLYERAIGEAKPKSIERCECYMRLGKCYMDSIGTKEDLEQAYEYFERALQGFYFFKKLPYALENAKECRICLGIIRKKMDMEVLKE